MKVKFLIKSAQTQPNQRIKLFGNLKALGNWEIK